jgi:GPH family glycoside/pentoside/hexuronide:cation symporter
MTQKFQGTWKLTGYACGMAGWSVLMNMVSVMLIYFYLPPTNAGLPQLLPQVSYLGILSLFSLILASGRLFDAITDPLIAWYSDRSKSRWGRRIPFMFVAIIPAGIFAVLLFFPYHNYESSVNYIWLFFIQLCYYLFLTIYIIPYNALVPELAETEDEKLKISVALSLAFVLGMVLTSQVPLLARGLERFFDSATTQTLFRISMGIIIIIACILMFIPVFVLNEKKYCKPVTSTVGIFKSLKTAFSSKNFLIFMVADSSFFVTLAIIASGLLYYVKVLLLLPEEKGTWFLAIMIGLSLAFYPLVIKMVKSFGKKRLIISSFIIFAVLFFSVMFMGKIKIKPEVYLYTLAVLAAFPTAVLGILPYTIIADISQQITSEKELKIEGMFFAVRTFGDKLGQTLGVMIFAILTLYGKDPGNDLGIRLSGLLGMGICLIATLTFLRYKE